MSTDHLADLAAQGVSIWLEHLSREQLTSGSLAVLVRDYHVTGVTTNLSIVQAALTQEEAYADALTELARSGASAEEALRVIVIQDVRDACDLLAPVFEATGGADGRVCIEVDPRLARDSDATIGQALELARTVGRPNVLITVPATLAGLSAITEILAHGVSVNATLIFSLTRYRAVMHAFQAGLEQARTHGHDLGGIHSVASFFISWVDTEVDARLAAVTGEATAQAQELRGRAAIANARLAYRAHKEAFATARWESLAAAGASPQRPLWACTSVKDPAYPDTRYVTELIAAGTVTAAPEATVRAVADHGEICGDTVRGTYAASEDVLDGLARLGIDYADVTDTLENEGIAKFEKAWEELLAGVHDTMEKVEK